MKNNKAFTIVEMMAVIVILFILALLIVPSVSYYMENSKDKYNNSIKKELILAAKDSYSDSRNSLVYSDMYGFITAVDLSSHGYLDNEFVDFDGNSCEEQSYVVAVAKKQNNYLKNKVLDYYACMKCGDTYNDSDWTSEEKDMCYEFNVIEKGADGYPNCEIIGIENKHATIKIDNSKNTNNIELGKIIDNSFDMKKYSIVNGSSVLHKLPWYNDIFSVFMIDKDNKYLIKCGRVKVDKISSFKYTIYDEDGEIYNEGDWSKSNLKLLIDGYEDYKRFELVDVGSGTKQSFSNVDENGITLSEDGEHNYRIIGYYDEFNEKTGQVEEQNYYSDLEVKIDKQKPIVTLSTSKSGWTNQNILSVNVNESLSGIKSVRYSLIDDQNWNLNWTSSDSGNGKYSKTVTTEMNGYVYVQVFDNAGNSSKEKILMMIDTTKPVITYSTSSTLDADGTYHAPFNFAASCADTGTYKSGDVSLKVNESAYDTSFTVSRTTSGNPATYSLSCTDKAGNVASASPSYKVTIYSSDSVCGVASYKSCATSACGVASYKSCRASGCDCETYKRCSSCSCAAYNSCAKKICGTTCTGSGGTTYTYASKRACTNARADYNHYSCSATTDVAFNYAGSCKAAAKGSYTLYVKKCTCKYKSCVNDGCTCATRNRCSVCGCETRKSCRNKDCGVESYNTCVDSACGVASYKTCWHY